MLCQRVLDDARKELNDPAEERWSNDDLLELLNDALLALAVARPDSSVTTTSFQLAEGTRQVLPTGGLRLIAVTRNMGSAGDDPGRAIQLGDMAAMDAISPDWHAEVGSGRVLEYLYNPLVPKQFFVYPGVPSSPPVYVEATYATAPSEVTDPASTLPVDDIYAPALREWMLYRAWGGDDEQSPNYAPAAARRASFFQLLGVKAQADVAASAKPQGRAQ